MRLRMLVSEAVRSVGSSISTTVAATMTVLIGMFLIGVFIALGTWVVSWGDHVKRELVVKVFFDTDVKPRQVNAVQLQLESNDLVKRVEFVSAKEGLARMKKTRPDLFKAAPLPYNPLGPALTVHPKEGEQAKAIASTLAPYPPGVHNVDYGKKKADRILLFAKLVWLTFIVAVLVLGTASTLLIANTIRLSIFARRREIEVMKLVGASNWFVRGPFMLEGLMCGLGGALAAVILLFLGKLALGAVLPRLDEEPDVHAIAFGLNALILVGAGLLLGAAGSGLTIRRFLRV